ncbi:MAG: PEP-CTERM sorting domain-containing protein [Pirellulales bacterium]
MRKCLGSLFALALISLSSMAAVAGPLTTDPAAIPAAQGSQVFVGKNLVATHDIHAIVDYAVYAPGAFSTSAALGFPADFSGGTEYIYAYEVYNTGFDANDATNITSLTVGLFPGGVSDFAVLVGDLPFTPELGGVPVSGTFNPPAGGMPKSNVRWSFASTPTPVIGFGLHSDILIFASPLPPQWKTSSVAGTFATAASALLPTPVPEPATVVLVATAAVSLLVGRRVRRKAR